MKPFQRLLRQARREQLLVTDLQFFQELYREELLEAIRARHARQMVECIEQELKSTNP